MRAWSLVPFVVCVACSSSGSTTESSPEPTEPIEDAGVEASPQPDASHDSAPPKASAGVGSCASCTATKCAKELQACGSSQACVNGLLDFNDCFGRQTDGTSGACGTKLEAAGASATALWSCDKAKCPGECGVR